MKPHRFPGQRRCPGRLRVETSSDSCLQVSDLAPLERSGGESQHLACFLNPVSRFHFCIQKRRATAKPVGNLAATQQSLLKTHLQLVTCTMREFSSALEGRGTRNGDWAVPFCRVALGTQARQSDHGQGTSRLPLGPWQAVGGSVSHTELLGMWCSVRWAGIPVT